MSTDVFTQMMFCNAFDQADNAPNLPYPGKMVVHYQECLAQNIQPPCQRNTLRHTTMQTGHILKRLALNVAGLFLLIVAALFHQEQLFLMAAALFLVPIVSYLLGRILMTGISCDRAGLVSCSEGEPVMLALSIAATGLLPKFYLRVRDRLPHWLSQSGGPPPLIMQLRPGEAMSVNYQVVAEKRGVYALGPVQVITTDPLGFFEYRQPMPCSSELVVYPTVLPLRQLFVQGAGSWGRDSLDSGAVRGDGLDFHGVREYREGDELRRVHWRTTARTRKLSVMEFSQGQTSQTLLALDLHRDAYLNTGDGPDSALECAIRIAASAAHFLLNQGYGVQLLSSMTIEKPLILQSPMEMARLLDLLAHAEADSPLSLSQVLQESERQIADGTSLLFITPAPSQPGLAAALDQARAYGSHSVGYALDAESFRHGAVKGRTQAGLPSAMTSVPTLTIQHGDNLQQVIEGWSYSGR